jgi:2-keto-3-deoxy-L-rhamnonate aldolase RhmA
LSDADSLKKRINDGETVLGVSAPITSTKSQLEEIFSKDSYDFVGTDSQHSPFNEERLVEFCGNAAELDMPVQFRIKHTQHTYLVGNLLDLGPFGIEVPQTETEETAQEAVDYFYYPQKGKRSWGPRHGTGAPVIVSELVPKGREDRLEYAGWWNNHGVLWLQIESVEAITKCHKLARPGVDCLSWGPADLSFSRESHPNHPFQSDDDCVRAVVSHIEGTGTRLAYRNPDPNNRAKYTDMGATVLLERPKP